MAETQPNASHVCSDGQQIDFPVFHGKLSTVFLERKVGPPDTGDEGGVELQFGQLPLPS